MEFIVIYYGFLQLMMVFPIRNYPHQNVFLSTYLKTGLCQGLLGAFIIKMIGRVTCLAGEKTPGSPRNQIPFASKMVLTHQD